MDVLIYEFRGSDERYAPVGQLNATPGMRTFRWPFQGGVAMELEASFVCAYCLQVNTIIVDSTGGADQEYVEDCQICCRPNRLRISIDDELESVDVQAEMP